MSGKSVFFINTGELGYDGPLYDGFLHMTDNMLGPSQMHIKYSSYVYDGFCIWRTNFPGPIESVISKFTCNHTPLLGYRISIISIRYPTILFDLIDKVKMLIYWFVYWLLMTSLNVGVHISRFHLYFPVCFSWSHGEVHWLWERCGYAGQPGADGRGAWPGGGRVLQRIRRVRHGGIWNSQRSVSFLTNCHLLYTALIWSAKKFALQPCWTVFVSL